MQYATHKSCEFDLATHLGRFFWGKAILFVRTTMPPIKGFSGLLNFMLCLLKCCVNQSIFNEKIVPLDSPYYNANFHAI